MMQQVFSPHHWPTGNEARLQLIVEIWQLHKVLTVLHFLYPAVCFHAAAFSFRLLGCFTRHYSNFLFTSQVLARSSVLLP